LVGIIPPPANTIPPGQFVAPMIQTQAQSKNFLLCNLIWLAAPTFGASPFQGATGSTTGSNTGGTQLPGSVFSNSGLNKSGTALPPRPQAQTTGAFQDGFGNPTSTFKFGGSAESGNFGNSSLNQTSGVEHSQLPKLSQGFTAKQDNEAEKPKSRIQLYNFILND